MLDCGPLRPALVEGLHQCRVGRKVTDQHTEPSRAESAAIEIQQVDVVEPGQISLYLIAILIEQTEEAN